MTCDNAESVFPQCSLPLNPCDVNGVSACNNDDVCKVSGKDAICETRGILKCNVQIWTSSGEN